MTTPSSVFMSPSGGGAGYVTQLGEQLLPVLRRAREILSCPDRNCDAACHACLLAYDTQHDMDDLNRHRALELLDEAFLRHCEAEALPEELRVFGAVACAQALLLLDLPSAIRQAIAGSDRPKSLALKPSSWPSSSTPREGAGAGPPSRLRLQASTQPGEARLTRHALSSKRAP